MSPAAKKPKRQTITKPIKESQTSTQIPLNGVMNLPTVAQLASLAAAMATPMEEPRVTAARALALWRACEGELGNFEDHESLRRAARAAETKFLAALGLNIFSVHGSKKDDLLPLKKFLNLCKPSPDTKAEDMIEKWRGFRQREINGALSKRRPQPSQSDLLNAVDERMRSDREYGISVGEVLEYWSDFKKFLRHDRKVKMTERGKKGGRPKKSLASP